MQDMLRNTIHLTVLLSTFRLKNYQDIRQRVFKLYQNRIWNRTSARRDLLLEPMCHTATVQLTDLEHLIFTAFVSIRV